MEDLLADQIPVASSCGGDGICGKCALQLEPAENFSPPSSLEKETLKRLGLEGKIRLSCQTRSCGSGVVDSDYW